MLQTSCSLTRFDPKRQFRSLFTLSIQNLLLGDLRESLLFSRLLLPFLLSHALLLDQPQPLLLLRKVSIFKKKSL